MVTKLRLARVKSGINVRDFARRLNLSESLLSKMETGKHYVPKKWRNILAEALDLRVEDICDEKGWPLTSDSNENSGDPTEILKPSESLPLRSSANTQYDLNGPNSSTRSLIGSGPDPGIRSYRRG